LVFHYDERRPKPTPTPPRLLRLIDDRTSDPQRRCAIAQFKQQCYVEQGHHQWKTPLAVRPLFLKSPERIEALVYLLQIGLTAYHLLQRHTAKPLPMTNASGTTLNRRKHLRAFACVRS